MIAAPALDSETAAKLAVVLSSPAAVQALQDAELQRAKQRKAILLQMRVDVAAPLQESEAHARAEAELSPKIAKAQQALQGLVALAREASVAALVAHARAERIRGDALRSLAALGGNAIAEAVAELNHAHRASLALIEFRPVLHLRGRVGPGAAEVDPAHRKRAERMAELADSLERLVFDAEVTPAEIERRCAAAVAEVKASTPEAQRATQWLVPAHDNNPAR